MRWNVLFEDLEAQFEAAADDALDAEIAERTRRELAATTLEGRLRAASGDAVELFVTGAGAIAGITRRVGAGWLMLETTGGPPAVVATQHVAVARNLPSGSRELGGDELARTPAGLLPVLRVLARDRAVTTIVLTDGAAYSGTIDRVGRDYFDLAEHSIDEPRRSSVVRGIRTIALAAVAVMRPRLE